MSKMARFALQFAWQGDLTNKIYVQGSGEDVRAQRLDKACQCLCVADVIFLFRVFRDERLSKFEENYCHALVKCQSVTLISSFLETGSVRNGVYTQTS